MAMATGTLKNNVEFEKKATVCKYVVPEGYGVRSKAGLPISVDEKKIQKCGSVAYYANVDIVNGELVTGTSRSVGVVGMADSIEKAESNCEDALKHVKGEAIFMRHDIGKRELVQRRVDHMKEIRGAR
jgi:phosphoribosylamine--glycine ligase